MFKGALVTTMGLLFMIGSFFLTAVRGGLSRGPGIQPSPAHTFYFLIVGLIVFIKGIFMLLQ